MDTAERILRCLSSALKKDGCTAGIIRALADELDISRGVATSITTSRALSEARGRSLDYMARAVNVSRWAGEEDDSLRARVTIQVKRYFSCGTLADVRDVAEYFTGLTGDQIQIIEPPDTHVGWGYGEMRYGHLPWGTPRAMLGIILVGADHLPASMPALMDGIDLVRAAGVYVPDPIIYSTAQEILSDAQGSTIWIVPAPLRTGYGAGGYGAGGYGYCVYAVRTTAEGAVDLQVTGEAAVVASIQHGVEPGRSPYGWGGYGGRVDAATIEYIVPGDAPVVASVSTDQQVLVETVLGYGGGRLGDELYGSTVGSVSARGESTIDLAIVPVAAVAVEAASYLGYGEWRYGLYEYGY